MAAQGEENHEVDKRANDKVIRRTKLWDMASVAFIVFIHSAAPTICSQLSATKAVFSNRIVELVFLLSIVMSWPLLLGGGLFLCRSAGVGVEFEKSAVSPDTHSLADLEMLKISTFAVAIGTALQGLGGLSWLIELRSHDGTIGLIVLAIVSSAILGVLALLLGEQAMRVHTSIGNYKAALQKDDENNGKFNPNHQSVRVAVGSM